MTLALNGVLTSNDYPAGNTGGVQIGPDPRGTQLDLVVGNAAAAVRLYYPEPGGAGALGGANLSDEFIVVAGPGQITQASYKNCLGFQARSFVAGSPATIYATEWEIGDPIPLGGQTYAGTLTGAGSQAPILSLPAGLIDGVGVNEIITNNTLASLVANGITANTPANTVFSFVIGSSAKINILGNNSGWFHLSLNSYWNAGSVDISSVAFIIQDTSAAGIFPGNIVTIPGEVSTFFASFGAGLSFYNPSNSLVTLALNIFQGSGSSQTLTSWQASIVQLATAA